MSTIRTAAHVSARGLAMPASPIRKLMPLAEEAKRRGRHVYHLNIGQPDLETPAVMRARLKDAPKVLAYSPSGGTPEYVESLRLYYARLGIELSPGEILATTGGSEALLFAFMACADAGAEILTVEPFYTNYRSFAAMAGLTIVTLVTRGEDGFHLPPRAAWEAKLTGKTRIVLLCNPNNPTGTVYTHEEILPVAEFCRDHGLFLISDEVSREFVYDGRHAVSAHTLGFPDLVVVVDSLSKRYSACGIRLGSLTTRNTDVASAASRRLASLSSSRRARRSSERTTPWVSSPSTRSAATSCSAAWARFPASSSGSPRARSTSWRAFRSRTARISPPGS